MLTTAVSLRRVPYMGFKGLFVAALSVTALFAQNVVGTWQGTIQTPQRPLRLVMKVTRADDESLKATFYSIDQTPQGIPTSGVTLQGTTFKLTIPAIGGGYEGKLSADGSTINGTFTQGGPLALNLVKATPATEWAIPEAPPPPKTMAADAKPAFEVATIKPSNPQTPGQAIQVGRGGGNSFTTLNTTLSELIKFAFELHDKQLTGGPAWLQIDKFDILAKPDTPGIPNVTQLRTMVQQLLADRFGLAFHRDKRELSAYVMTADKAAVKMTKVEGGRGNLPGFGGAGVGAIRVGNATMAEFAGFLQGYLLDRPVVDQTGLTDRYDFTFKFKPEAAQIAAAAAAAGGNAPTLPQEVEDRPDLLTAMLQQLGLRVESGKAQVDVLVIDKVTKPTEN
jgi:uncharacterized protein (TIGR03435 family)